MFPSDLVAIDTAMSNTRIPEVSGVGAPSDDIVEAWRAMRAALSKVCLGQGGGYV